MRYFLILSMLATSLTSFANSIDCTPIAAKWAIVEESGQSNVIEIRKDCTAKILQEASRHHDENLDVDYAFKIGEQWRMQYRYKPGTKDENGNPAPYPLPAELAKSLQGNISLNQDGSISFGIDAFDAWCAAEGVQCPSGHFFKIP